MPDPARNVTADILFAEASGDFGGLRAPLLRYCAGLTWGTSTLRSDFIASAVAAGYNGATAATCWANGRRFMQEMELEE